MKIANINIAADYIDQQFFSNRFRKYEYGSFTEPDMILKSISVNDITKPNGIKIEQIKDESIIHMDNNRLCRYLSDINTGKIINAIYYNNTYSEVEIHLVDGKQKAVFTMTELEYMYTGFAFSDRLTDLGGAVLHGSAIAYCNQGIVFSANSGTGKSTHANLWKKYFSDEVIIVNDDKPAIRFYGGIPFIFGTPWSGKSDKNVNMQVPLKAVVFIRQAETNWIERLNIRKSIGCLMSQISRPYYDQKIGLKTMDIIENLVQTIPVYKLHCNISTEAVDVVYKQLINDGIVKI